MRIVVAVTAFAGVLVLTASALAVMPRARSSFEGLNTTEKRINGYRPEVTFTVTASGRELRKFMFETIGCFGIGSFPIGVNPYAESQWQSPTKILVGKLGSFTMKVRPTSAFAEGAKMVATISGSFTSPGVAVGKVVYSMTQNGSGCGPKTIKFKAAVTT
jgi:hypothetical protein